MKLIFNQPHKSIGSFEYDQGYRIFVLTGVNGAGKSHLLEAIECDAVSVEGVARITRSQLIHKFDWNTLVPQDNGAFLRRIMLASKRGFWSEILQNRLKWR